MPELPEVEAVRRDLEPVMQGARFERVLLRRSNLRIPFPRNFAGRLQGHSMRALTRRGKYLLAELSSGETLIIHLGMSGSFDVDRGGREPQRHDHVVFQMSSGATVTFNDPRRFGLMDIAARGQLERYPALSAMGPEPLSAEFDAATLARACRGKKVALKLALLDQRVVAGIGNLWKAESLWRAQVSPWRKLGDVSDEELELVLAEAARLMRRSVENRREERLVYRRAGRPCPRCGEAILSRGQGDDNRTAYWCPHCQRGEEPPGA